MGDVPDTTDTRPFYENNSHCRSVIDISSYLGHKKNGECIELHATQVVITAGYYADSCIDYIQDEDRAFEHVSDCISMVGDVDEVLYRKGERLLKREARLANKIINRIKKEYGLIEVKRVATFSNGEAVYKKVGRKG
jgi:hypothetical protein